MKTKIMTKTLLAAALMALSTLAPASAAPIQYSFTVQQLKDAVAAESSFGGVGFCPGAGNLQHCGIYSILLYDENFAPAEVASMTPPVAPVANAAWKTQAGNSFSAPMFLDNSALVNIAFVTSNTGISGNTYYVEGSNQIATAPLSDSAVFRFIVEASQPVSGNVQTNFWLGLNVIAFDPQNNHVKAGESGHFMLMTIGGTPAPEVPEASTWMMALGALGVFAGMRFRRMAA